MQDTVMRAMTYQEFPGILPARLDPAEWQKQAEDIRARTLDLFGPFPTRRCPLEARVLGEEPCAGYRRLHVEYRSEPDDLVRAYLLVPNRAHGRSPAVIAIHTSAGSGKDSVVGKRGLRHPGSPAIQECMEDRHVTALDEPVRNYAYALDAVEHGYVVLAPDMDACGERAPAGRPWDTAPFYRRCPDWSVLGKGIWDISRAVDYLETLEFVDTSRLAVMGHCFGGYYSVLAAGFDQRLGAVLANSAIWTFRTTDYDWARYHDREYDVAVATRFHGANAGVYCHVKRLREYLTTEPGVLRKPLPVDYWEMACLVAPRPLFVGVCSKDLAGPTCQHLGAIALGQETESRMFTALHRLYDDVFKAPDNLQAWVFETEHTWTPEGRQAGMAWLGRQAGWQSGAAGGRPG